MLTILMWGALQSTPREDDEKSDYEPLRKSCEDNGFKHITPQDIHTFIPAKTSLNH